MSNTVTIGAMRYDLIADTDKFEKSMTATRQELRQSESAFRKTLTPVEKFEKELEKLNNLRRKGLITAQTYNRAIEKERQNYENTTKAIKKHRKSIVGLSTDFKTLATAAAGLAVVQTGLRSVTSQLSEIDEIAKQARLLGMSANDLQTFRLAAAEIAGLGSGQVDMAIQRFGRRLGQASQGTGEAAKAIEQLGLNAKQLSDGGAVFAFKQVAAAISSVENPLERLAIAQKLFDSEGAAMVQVLNAGSEAFDQYASKVRETGLAFTEDQAAGVETFNDRFAELTTSAKGFSREIAIMAAELTPVLEKLTHLLNMANQGFDNIELFKDILGGRIDDTGRRLTSGSPFDSSQSDQAAVGGFFGEAIKERAIDTLTDAILGLTKSVDNAAEGN